MNNIPNILTFLRLLSIPFLYLLLLLPYPNNMLYISIVFLLASITDWLDGYIARKYNQCTELGKFLDPVVDKIYVAAVLLIILFIEQSFLVLITSCIIISREIYISALREWMAKLGKSKVVEVAFIGKLKTSLQMLALFTLLLSSVISELLIYGKLLLVLAAGLTIWSMVSYTRLALFNIRN